MEILSMPSAPSSAPSEAQMPPAPGERQGDAPMVSTNVTITPENLANVAGDKQKPLSEYDKAVLKSFAEIEKEDEASEKKAEEDGEKEVDVGEHVKTDAFLDAATALDPKTTMPKSKIVVDKVSRDRFLDCLVTGERYAESFSLYNGKIRGIIRCRSLDETEAMEAYIRRKVVTREIVSQAEYTALVRRCLLASQIAELNGVKFPELEHPLFACETEEGMRPPAWLGRLDAWGDRPDAFVVLLVGRIVEFEARYWAMIRSSEDENFWKTGEYIEE